jgi:hypothetical protein
MLYNNDNVAMLKDSLRGKLSLPCSILFMLLLFVVEQNNNKQFTVGLLAFPTHLLTSLSDYLTSWLNI